MMPASGAKWRREKEIEPMSMELETADAVERANLSNAVTYKFKVTDENRNKGALVAVNEDVRERVIETAIHSPQWRSVSQFVNDALTFYLDGGNETVTVAEIIEGARWNSENALMASITPTLFYEIEMLVNHAHTPWNTKQEFYICALFNYIAQGTPMIDRR